MVYGRQNGLTGGGITKAGTIGMFTSCLHEKCSIADSKTSKDSGKQKIKQLKKLLSSGNSAQDLLLLLRTFPKMFTKQCIPSCLHCWLVRWSLRHRYLTPIATHSKLAFSKEASLRQRTSSCDNSDRLPSWHARLLLGVNLALDISSSPCLEFALDFC